MRKKGGETFYCHRNRPKFLLLPILRPKEFRFYRGFPAGTSGKEPTWQGRRGKRPGSIAGWGRSPGDGNGNPLQYSCLENPMDRAW